MAFGDFFKPAASQQQPANNGGQSGGAQNNGQQGQQQQNANNGGQQNNQNQGTGPNGGAANTGGTGGQQAGSQSQPQGIDRFSKMWDTPSGDGNPVPAFALDPKMLGEVASQQDFMKGLDPELVQKATSGDIKSLMDLIQKVGQNTYRTSLEHASMLTDKFVGAREAHSSKNLGTNVRKELTTHALSAIPNFKNPVIQKQLSSTADRLQSMHPDASPQEIAHMTMEYFQELTAAIQDPTKAKDGNGKDGAAAGPKGEDYWNKYFETANAQDAQS